MPLLTSIATIYELIYKLFTCLHVIQFGYVSHYLAISSPVDGVGYVRNSIGRVGRG